MQSRSSYSCVSSSALPRKPYLSKNEEKQVRMREVGGITIAEARTQRKNRVRINKRQVNRLNDTVYFTDITHTMDYVKWLEPSLDPLLKLVVKGPLSNLHFNFKKQSDGSVKTTSRRFASDKNAEVAMILPNHQSDYYKINYSRKNPETSLKNKKNVEYDEIDFKKEIEEVVKYSEIDSMKDDIPSSIIYGIEKVFDNDDKSGNRNKYDSANVINSKGLMASTVSSVDFNDSLELTSETDIPGSIIYGIEKVFDNDDKSGNRNKYDSANVINSKGLMASTVSSVDFNDSLELTIETDIAKLNPVLNEYLGLRAFKFRNLESEISNLLNERNDLSLDNLKVADFDSSRAAQIPYEFADMILNDNTIQDAKKENLREWVQCDLPQRPKDMKSGFNSGDASIFASSRSKCKRYESILNKMKTSIKRVESNLEYDNKSMFTTNESLLQSLPTVELFSTIANSTNFRQANINNMANIAIGFNSKSYAVKTLTAFMTEEARLKKLSKTEVKTSKTKEEKSKVSRVKISFNKKKINETKVSLHDDLLSKEVPVNSNVTGSIDNENKSSEVVSQPQGIISIQTSSESPEIVEYLKKENIKEDFSSSLHHLDTSIDAAKNITIPFKDSVSIDSSLPTPDDLIILATHDKRNIEFEVCLEEGALVVVKSDVDIAPNAVAKVVKDIRKGRARIVTVELINKSIRLDFSYRQLFLLAAKE